jgi:hypothetical protein
MSVHPTTLLVGLNSVLFPINFTQLSLAQLTGKERCTAYCHNAEGFAVQESFCIVQSFASPIFF